MQRRDLIIIGGGPAGLTAGIYAARSGLDAVVIDKGLAGGLASEAPVVENYPGFESIQGMSLMDRIRAHAEKYVDVHKFETAQKVVLDRGISVSTDKGEYISGAVIFATGTSHKKLDVPGEKEFLGRGVSYCPTCDGFFFRGKKVLVVGGGNTAATDAIYLKQIGCDVALVHRRDRLRAEQELQKRLLNLGVKIVWNSVVEEIRGKDVVEAVMLKNVRDGSELELRVDGVFISVGEVPNSELARSMGVALDKDGYIVTDKSQRTNLRFVYAAGDVTGGVKQIIVACAEGATAALSAFNDLKA
jgi:thioredoxin reductase (NADPH)